MNFKDRKLEKWQRNRLLCNWLLYVIIMTTFLLVTTGMLRRDKNEEQAYWNLSLGQAKDMADEVATRSTDATSVTVGTYIENLKEISLKTSYYRLVAQIWFRWDGDAELDMKNNFRVYKGLINKSEIIKDYHENGVNYQLIRCDVTVTKDYWTRRFPLESHQLRMYVISNYPVEQVVFVDDHENSGVNKNLSISGYNIRQNDTAVINIKQTGTHGDPELTGDLIIPEHMTAIELNRNSWGLYVKCFTALVGTLTWVLITLFLNSYHHIDPLSMIPAALFGTVSNIMVGANLLPDALQLGLLEFVNMFGIMSILAVTMTIININRIRNKYQDKEFAGFVGRLMFYTSLFFIILGNILLPVSAYMF